MIQKYAVATIASINLTDIKPLNRQDLRILALGLSANADVGSGKIFAPLTDVPKEIDKVIGKIPEKKLLDNDFTSDRAYSGCTV